MKRLAAICLTLALCIGAGAANRNSKLDDQVLQTMKKATEYMLNTVGYNGGFVWAYLPDLSRQWGEMESKRTMAWVQSGTPQMGNLFLDAYHATGDEFYYDCAEKVAASLIWGQLDCGGWNYCYDYAGEESLVDWYNTVGKNGWRLEEFQHYYGNATFDDCSTTDAAKFLLRMYAEKFDPKYRGALDKAINFVLESQYPIGGWPQRYPLRFDHPFRGNKDYSSFITLNDEVIPECTDFLLQCYQVLGTQNLKAPILRAMYCSILLQQSEPYAGWSDQYTVEDLKPAAARSYEPLALSTATTQRMINLMIKYYKLTGDGRFIAGIPAAIRFLERVRLPKSEVEKAGLKWNENTDYLPLFFNPYTEQPQYVHRVGSNVQNGHYYVDQDIRNIIIHYGSFVRNVNIQAIKNNYEAVKNTPVEEFTKDSPLLSNEAHPLAEYYAVKFNANADAASLAEEAEAVIGSLTKEGYWLAPIRDTSNPYKPYSDPEPSNETKYCSTNVGDEYDTSCYETDIMGITTRDFINKMGALIRYHLSVK